MPRPPRLDAPGSFHHVWARGVDRFAVFRDDEDRDAYVRMAAAVFARTSTTCLAWCEMTNHVHFVVETGGAHISKVFHSLQTRYAKHFNRRHHRVGHLFQGRFGSGLREDGAGLDVAVAYVHLNPLRSPLCRTMAELAEYPWSGHAEILGRVPCRLVDVERTLRLFGPGGDDPRASMCRFLDSAYRSEGPGSAKSDGEFGVPLTARSQSDARALGVASVHARSEALDRLHAELADRAFRRDSWKGAGGTLEGLRDSVCRAVGCDPVRLREGRRSRAESLARSVLAHVACDVLQIPGAEVGRLTGTSRQGIALARDRGRELIGALGLEAAALVAVPLSSCQEAGQSLVLTDRVT